MPKIPHRPNHWAETLAMHEGPSFGLDYARYLPRESDLDRKRRASDEARRRLGLFPPARSR